MLNNEHINDPMEQFGIYHENGIQKQAMMAPNAVVMDGNDLIDNACIVKVKSSQKNKNFDPKKKRRGRRGKRNKNKNKNKELNKDEMDRMKCNDFVAYLDMIRNQRL